MKLNFYDVDKDYTNYLRTIDNKIPYIGYENRDKFLCGTVLTINNINYYVPVSSNKNKFFSSFIIYDEKKESKNPLATLRFSFMFPCPIECVHLKEISKENNFQYKILLQKEYEYCNKHINQIKKKAEKIYKIAQNEELRKKLNLCNFKLLEENYIEYLINSKNI